MASNRHLGRIVALQTLYELDFRIGVKEEDLDTESIIDRNVQRYSEVVDDKEFVTSLIRGVLADTDSLDEFIQPLAPDWPLSQIARVDRVILRIGTWEMKNSDSIPIRVIINESVELAKGFGADNSSKFINGVLGTAARKLGKVAEDTKPVKPGEKPATARKKNGTDPEATKAAASTKKKQDKIKKGDTPKEKSTK